MRFTTHAIVAVLVGGCTKPQPEQAPEQALTAPPRPASACDGEPRPDPPARIAQGVAGVVCFWKGNFQPGDSDGTIEPVARTIEVYAAISGDQAVRAADGAFYASVATPLVTKAVSGDDGRFEVALAPGTYSLFVREDRGLYANRFDGAGLIAPVVVAAGAVTHTQLDVDYASVH